MEGFGIPAKLCSVLKCESTTTTHRLFCLPARKSARNKARAEKWMAVLKGHIKEVADVRVCIKHFSPEDIDPSRKSGLFEDACPKLMLGCAETPSHSAQIIDPDIPIPYIVPSSSKFDAYGDRELSRNIDDTHETRSHSAQIIDPDIPIPYIVPSSSKFDAYGDSELSRNFDDTHEAPSHSEQSLINSEFPVPSVFPSDNSEDTDSALKLKYALRKIRDLQKKLTNLEAGIKHYFNSDQLDYLKSGSMKGRSWSIETLAKAYKIRLTCGITGYNTVRELGEPLPSPRTLQRRIEHLKFTPGLLNEVLMALKTKVETMTSDYEKYCCIILDEMAVIPKYDFDASTGLVMGKPTIPSSNGRSEEYACHGLVYMLAGVTARWKQVVGYQLTGKSFDATYVQNDLLNIIYEAENMGLKVCCIISDMSGQNQALWRLFNIQAGRLTETRNFCEHPCDPTRALYFQPDPCHLMKHIRDHLVNGQSITLPDEYVAKYSLPSNVATIDHIKMLHTINDNMDLKLCPYLKDNVVSPSHFEKMRVGLAVALLHHDTAAGLEYCVERKLIPNAALTTAWFCKTIYRWFKLVTSRARPTALSATNAKYEDNLMFFKEIIDLFNGIKIGERRIWKPVQTGVTLATTNAIELGQYFLEEKGFHYLCLGRFTQDALENLFSMIRYINPVPSPRQFKMALRIISVAQYFKPNRRGSYQVEEEGEYLAEFLKVDNPEYLEVGDVDESELDFSYVDQDEQQVLYYLAGRTVRQLFNVYTINCTACTKALRTTRDDPTVVDLSVLTHLKAVSSQLIYVSLQVFQLLLRAEHFLKKYESCILEGRIGLRDVKEKFLISQTDSSFPKCHAIEDKLIYIYFKARIYFIIRKANDKHSINAGPSRSDSRSIAMRAAVQNIR